MRYLTCFLTHPVTAIMLLQLHIISLLTTLLVKNTVGKAMNPDLVAKLPLEVQAAIAAFEAYVIPAAQAIDAQATAQADHDRQMQVRIMDTIQSVPEDQRANLLLGLQANEIEGACRVINTVFAGYTGLIATCGRAAVAFNMTERTPVEDLTKLNLFI